MTQSFRRHDRAADLKTDIGALVLDSVDDAIAVLRPCDGEMLVAAVNRGFETLLGYTATEVIGWPLELVTQKRLAPAALFASARSSGAFERVESVLSTKQGEELRVNIGIRPFDIDGTEGGLLVIRDVTEYRRLEQIAAATELSESVAYILAGIRHEIGNPINSLKSVVALLSDRSVTLPEERRADYLRRAAGEIARVETLLEQLRPFNMHESVRLERIRPRPFLQRFLNIAREDCRSRGTELQLNGEFSADAEIWADQRLLQQLLLLLLANALDAVETVATKRIVLGCGSDSRTCRITLSDSGVGMTAEELTNAQRPFVTTKSKGTGLGLPLVRRYAALTKCAFSIWSVPGKGTVAGLEFEHAVPSRSRSD